jgi:hypothetical protein
LARIAGELEVFRGWTEASDSTEWVHAFGACDQPPDGRQQRSFEIDDMDLLDVARRIEDAIEELERSALSE